jgi:hypothetical protein
MEGRKVVAWIKQKESEGLTKGDILTMREMYEEEVGASMSQATWRRRIREVFSNGDLTIEDLPKVLQKIGERFSPEELRAIAQGESADAKRFGTPTVVSREGTTLKFGFVTDLHIGSKYFHPNKLRAAYDMFRSEGVTDILISGDITEGMSNRDGHVFECTHLGYAAQRDYAEELLREWQGEIYAIDGNHDRWYGLTCPSLATMRVTCSLIHPKGSVGSSCGTERTARPTPRATGFRSSSSPSQVGRSPTSSCVVMSTSKATSWSGTSTRSLGAVFRISRSGCGEKGSPRM